MKKTVFTGICLMILTATSIIGCSKDEQDVVTSNSLEFNLKSNVRDFESLLEHLYGTSYRIEDEITVTDEDDTYTLRHVTTADGTLEGYTITGSNDNAYIEHNARMGTITNYTDDSAQPEGIYDVSDDSYYLDHGFTPILVQDPGEPTPVIYRKRLSYGACSRPDANGNSFAGVYVTRRFLGISGQERQLLNSSGTQVTVPCSGNPLQPEPYTGAY
ncbi:hypothetical protein [Flavobacterium sp. NRK1]|uniref:hypothetical protein n=1 Tax=Flavobacterium sp. NRK1 TaxID=2954929 RepID=UPI0020937AC7|nr:hypothetical protein [Flavobacterium sp. NRK1]MCO6146997.1 hypothetical protein [Flavobacterium sp. NRK1]